jgi:hypothetical protein
LLSVEIKSLSGNTVKTAMEKQIPVADFPAGVYLVTVTYLDGTSQTGKFVKL